MFTGRLKVSICTLLLTMSVLGPVLGQVPDTVTSSCTADSSVAVSDATAALQSAPLNLDARFRLADALLEASCYDAAVHILEEGEQTNPRSSELQKRLRTTRSLQTEQNYFEGLERAQIAARAQRNQLRCTRLGDIAACDEALKLRPDDAATQIAKADALLKGDRPAEALSIYRRARDLGADAASIQAKVTAADMRRKALLADCESGAGPGALQACRAALLAGADDEFAIHKRKGVLLQAANQPGEALNEFIAATAIRNDDRAVALAVVALMESTRRKDAAALAALGSAQLTLGSPAAAIPSLRQAQTLAPGIPDIKARLLTAERLAQAEPSRSAAAIPAVNRPAAQPGSRPITTAGIEPVRPRTYSNVEPASRTH